MPPLTWTTREHHAPGIVRSCTDPYRDAATVIGTAAALGAAVATDRPALSSGGTLDVGVGPWAQLARIKPQSPTIARFFTAVDRF